MIACGQSRSQMKIVDLLIEKGASIHIKDQNGWTPLFYAIDAGNNGMFRILVSLSLSLSPLNWKLRYSDISFGLHFQMDAEIAHRLLECGAEPNLQDKNGVSIFDVRFSAILPKELSIFDLSSLQFFLRLRVCVEMWKCATCC
jgi:ankyrin repeat protein